MQTCRGPYIGQPIIGCDCAYCYPLLREYYKERRQKDAPHRAARFKFVREIIKRDIIVDDNVMDRSLITLWGQIIDDSASLTENIIKLPLLLKRLGRYVEFDHERLKPETIQHVRDIWNKLNSN